MGEDALQGLGAGLDAMSAVDPLDMPGRRVGRKQLEDATALLAEYKRGKANLEARVVNEEQWYKLRQWDAIRAGVRAPISVEQAAGTAPAQPADERPEPASAWLFNVLCNKHADAMDNYPVPNVLPREKSDEASAKTLSSILPVVIERNGFEQTYDLAWWEKLKHGTSLYGVFWDPAAENGLGDVAIREIDILNIFWQPGISDVQDSRALFIVDLADTELLEQKYPQYKGKIGVETIDVAEYVHDDQVDTSGKSVVVDMYYHVDAPDGGRPLLHMIKFVGSCLLYASEDDPALAGRGLYDHGEYPVVPDVLFPDKGTPAGFGYVSVTKEPQLYIDKLSQNILESAMMATRPRFFATKNSGVNREQFLDWGEAIIEVEGGSVDDSRLKQLQMTPLEPIYVNVLQMKIDELKETSANRDVTSGGTTSGVTAAAAIAALQEAGNKCSRDMIASSYRAYVRVCYLCIELLRQFYDESRSFRITGENGVGHSFVEYSNADIREQPAGRGTDGGLLLRRPVFDITIAPQKKNPFSRMSQNELAKELYSMGFFNPERAQESLIALELMSFDGKDKVVEQVRQGQTLLALCQQMAAQLEAVTALTQAAAGQVSAAGPAATAAAPGGSGGAPGINRAAESAQKAAMTGYGERLAARSTPTVGAVSSKTAPRA